MQYTNQHKALALTFLISGTVVLSVFNVGLKKQNNNIAESYYEIEPEKKLTEEELKTLDALEKLNNSKAETNKAYNETQKTEHFAEAFKPIAPPEDFVPESRESVSILNPSYRNKYKNTTNNNKFNQDDISKYDKVKDVLQKQHLDSNNSKSTISFSLKNRMKVYIPIPIYLCEVNGRITVNITVNSNGDVIDTYLNTTSTSNNACLLEHALEYAKQSRFSKDASKKSQLGSITFNFIGK